MKVLAIVCALIALYGFCLMYRNQEVCAFRTGISHQISKTLEHDIWQRNFKGMPLEEWEEYVEQMYGLHDKYSYNQMLFSFRPLKLEKWYTEEEIKLMKGIR